MQTIIFDFGNVLGKTVADETTAIFVDDIKQRKIIRDVVFDPDDWDRLNRGIMTDEEMLAKIDCRLPLELWEDAHTVYDNWTNAVTPVSGMTSLVRGLKQEGYGLYLLSNATMTFAQKYREIPWMNSLLSRFDGLVFSAEVQMAKPDREIYEYLLTKYSLNAEECIFVDDCMPNIEAANALGIHGYCFDGDAIKLRKFLGIVSI